jgi:hypothetical protein
MRLSGADGWIGSMSIQISDCTPVFNRDRAFSQVALRAIDAAHVGAAAPHHCFASARRRGAACTSLHTRRLERHRPHGSAPAPALRDYGKPDQARR